MLELASRSNPNISVQSTKSFSSRPVLVAALVMTCLPVVGCESKSDAPAPTPAASPTTVQTQAGPPAIATTQTAQAAPTPATAAPSAAPSAASPPSTSEISDEMPSLDDFGKAKEIRVSGSSALGCETKLVKGWLRVLCHETKTGGKPTALTVKEGEVDGKTKVTVRQDEVLQLITPVAEGTRLEAEFEWSDSKSKLVIDRPSGTADADVSGSFAGAAVHPPPKEVETNGTAAIINGGAELGCNAFTYNDWIMVQCGAQSKLAGKPQGVEVKQGKKEGITKIWVTKGAIVTLLTPFAIGSEIEAEFEWDTIGKKTLKLSWPAGQPLPLRVGGFDGFADIPGREEFAKADMVNVERGLANNCTSKMTRGWLRVACTATNSSGGKPQKIELVKGAKPDDAKIETLDGAMNLTVKVEAGADIEALFTWSDKPLKLLVQWPEGKSRPDVLGRFEDVK